MSPENEKRLQRDVADVKEAVAALKIDLAEAKREVHTLTTNIIGDPVAHPPVIGVLNLIKAHHTEMYGDDNIQHVGLKKKYEDLEHRVESLEADIKWVKITAGGISTGAFAILWIIDWLAKR